MSGARELDAAYGHCEAVTRAEAANFFYGIRLLARERRRSICAVYAFARRVDDIGDGSLQPARKLALLDAEQLALASIAGSRASSGQGLRTRTAPRRGAVTPSCSPSPTPRDGSRCPTERLPS